jgi:serralysin
VVEQYVPGRTDYRLVGSHRLTPINDEDDGQSLTTGETYTGTINYPADIDWFVISLARGDEVTVLAEAAMIDPVLAIGPSGSASDEYVEDDDGGRGMLGSSAALAYRASSPGDYLVVVRSFTGADVGGYLLTIASPK